MHAYIYTVFEWALAHIPSAPATLCLEAAADDADRPLAQKCLLKVILLRRLEVFLGRQFAAMWAEPL